MANYYEELIATIRAEIAEENYREARKLIEEEYRMPYIPRDTELILRELERQLPSTDKPRSAVNFTDAEIIELLQKDEESQLVALGALESRNVRAYLKELERYLCSSATRELKCLAIMILISQQVQTEMTMEEPEARYNFIPASLLPPHLSDGYQKASVLLRDLLEQKNPSAARLAEELLLRECYRKLPESYEEEEAEPLARGVYKAVALALGQQTLWDDYKTEHDVTEELVIDITI